MYRLKSVPEDFIVKEIISLPLGKSESGEYSYFLLQKKNLSTPEALSRIAERLRLSVKFLGYAGNKDKTAVTEQFCSAKGIKKEILERVTLPNIKIAFQGYGPVPISLGNNRGNRFIIILRNLTKKETAKLEAVKNKTFFFPNYFDEQRFSKKNVEIGRCIIRKDFAQAVRLLQETEKDNSWMGEYLLKRKNDYLGVLRQFQKKILLLYIHAYQSFLFNNLASICLKKRYPAVKTVRYSQGVFVFPSDIKKETLSLPTVGFDTEVKNKQIKLLLQTVMKKEKLSFSDFIIRSFPELSQEGQERSLLTKAKELSISQAEKDELNPGKEKIIISFSLPKGSYATMFIRFLLA